MRLDIQAGFRACIAALVVSPERGSGAPSDGVLLVLQSGRLAGHVIRARAARPRDPRVLLPHA
jgi:hypothetical protein